MRRSHPPEPGREEELVERNILKLAPGGMSKILEGTQASTTRLGLRKYTLGSALLVDGRRELRIWIWLLQTLVFDALNIGHARAEGFPTPSDLRQKIRRFYPGIAGSDRITHIRFYVLDDGIDMGSARRRRWPGA